MLKCANYFQTKKSAVFQLPCVKVICGSQHYVIFYEGFLHEILEKHKAEVVQENISKVQKVVQEQDDIIIPLSGECPAATSADHQIEQRHPLSQVDRLKVHKIEIFLASILKFVIFLCQLCQNIKILQKKFLDWASIGGATIIPRSLKTTRNEKIF